MTLDQHSLDNAFTERDEMRDWLITQPEALIENAVNDGLLGHHQDQKNSLKVSF
ncbi:hypothetical protein [Vibrio pacinii]|uniref:hypothetical protein n=1 Tax=Vibrio pacinii TaxID=170674 RepID=UPI000B158998|nr:hypothetical protein [Vibrio pacinii]